jgi:hypothetical protein
VTRTPYPSLDADSKRQTLIRWLATCDPNGIWGFADKDEDVEPLTVDDLWEAVSEMAREE